MSILDGVRIVSFNHFLMGPLGIQHLADLGADVIAVEPPAGAFQRHWSGGNVWVDGESMLLWCANRNKRSLAVDLKHSQGKEIVHRLVRHADVVAENFRPGVMDRLGLGFEDLKKIRPDLIYASGSGFGPDGPYAQRPGQDLLLQAFSGLAATVGEAPNGAIPVGVSVVDHHGAALLALGIVAALFNRIRTGEGMKVDVSLLAAAIDLQAESFTCFLNSSNPTSVRRQRQSGSWYQPGPYGIYRCLDGAIAISLTAPSELGAALEDDEIGRIPENACFQQQERCCELVAKSVEKRTLAWLEEHLSRRSIWHARVNDYPDVIADPQVQHNGHFIQVNNRASKPIGIVTHPILYNGRTLPVLTAPPALGAHSAEILSELGYSKEEIMELSAKEVIRT
jgi:crotonobetainyl-CoA:carnitine CoA-transferase CaiB-like acyl-CoA transferase